MLANLDRKPHIDPLAQSIISYYNQCRIGTGGMGFNWQSGTWGDTPMWLVDCCMIIDSAHGEHQKRESDARQAQQEREKIVVDYTQPGRGLMR